MIIWTDILNIWVPLRGDYLKGCSYTRDRIFGQILERTRRRRLQIFRLPSITIGLFNTPSVITNVDQIYILLISLMCRPSCLQKCRTEEWNRNGSESLIDRGYPSWISVRWGSMRSRGWGENSSMGIKTDWTYG